MNKADPLAAFLQDGNISDLKNDQQKEEYGDLTQVLKRSGTVQGLHDPKIEYR